jgi:DNA-binding MarR family transcriptional regulator
MSDFKELDPLLHQRLRLAIMSMLVTTKKAEFKLIKQKTEATAGNLSIQLRKLEEAGYLKIEKSFRDNYPLTEVSITGAGQLAFNTYVEHLQSYLKP